MSKIAGVIYPYTMGMLSLVLAVLSVYCLASTAAQAVFAVQQHMNLFGGPITHVEIVMAAWAFFTVMTGFGAVVAFKAFTEEM